ncbi:hypothetical protein [Salinicola aestuarinus]|uniref:hypothetical protein n=1 Tax=Salinicola aestuarinus TaxID=1949082 RepID=UPI000DA21AFF|nr:hypothetical protein [Salinicola aestuarinus]
MNYRIACSRCGCTDAIAPDAARDWDEISCKECGDFITTCGQYRDRQGPSYSLQALNMSRGLILKMARETAVQHDTQREWKVSA